MAVDKKSQHVGNHGGAYTDNDGMSRQFTYVDHDKKLKVAVAKPLSEDDLALLKDSLRAARNETIEKILSISASLCPSVFSDFTIRGDKTTIEWNEVMLKDEGLSTQRLNELLTILENRIELGGINISS